MPRITCLLMLILASAVFAEEEWPNVKFTEVRAYAWPDDGKHKEEKLILDDMSLKAGVINEKGAVLSAEQVQALLAAVTGVHPEFAVAPCYIPHNAFIFFNDKKPVAFIEICFDCKGYRFNPPRVPKFYDLKAMAKLFIALKLPAGQESEVKK